MPKFEIEYEVDLNETLRSLGVNVSFDKERANLNATPVKNYFSSNHRLYLSELIHKAVVETSEEGTEAAAPQ